VKSVDLKHKATKIGSQLAILYPNPPIPLDHDSPFTLLIAVMLSAQSTDKKVNEITPSLFEAAYTAKEMALLPEDKIRDLIAQIGLAPTKAKRIKKTSEIICEQHDGQVPNTFEALEALPGVGHKTASVVMSQAYGVPAFPVDTHIHRLATRWGLTSGKNVERTETDLKYLYPEALWNDLHLQIIYFGREHCPARNHDPAQCPICSWAGSSGS